MVRHLHRDFDCLVLVIDAVAIEPRFLADGLNHVSGLFLANEITERVHQLRLVDAQPGSPRGKRRTVVAVSWSPRMSSRRKQISSPPDWMPAIGASIGPTVASMSSG